MDRRWRPIPADELRVPRTPCQREWTPPAAQDAVILNGMTLGDTTYDYSVELDFTMEDELPGPALPKYAVPQREETMPPLRSRGVGLYEATAWLPQDALGNMHKQQAVESWTTDDWDRINYYVLNKQNIGLGHKLVAVPKDMHAQLFGENEPVVTVLAIEGRRVALLFKRQ
ncbi:hypothetical protein QTH97_33800 [Variovorax sp. J22R24]|uniref:hypothetical protein n=1 Tax=Variovorax gracilis TaxID=3053502 RepID=UPI00257568E5|nr:hypothetical protein [Variovorax sp. J22R24]MDM0109926.1 hypothetical protein [Variovorax sp. J22R24]